MDQRACGTAGPRGYSSLPGDIILLVEEHLREHDAGEHVAAMRAVCRHWWRSLGDAPARLQPLGKPARLAAFPRAIALDYSARGAGQSLTDAELAAACTLLGARLERLNVSGAFQLTTAGIQGALRACTALLHLAADGSTLQDDAFAALLPPPELSSSSSSGGGSGSNSIVDQPGPSSWPSPAVLPGSSGSPGSIPLQHLESLSLSGCLFLRGSLLSDLAAACPRLAALDLSGCSLALNLNPDTAALLGRLASLQRLALDGNQVDDVSIRHVAALPRLRELSVRRSDHLTDAGLRHLAVLRGSTMLARSNSMEGVASGSDASSSSSSTGGSGSGSGGNGSRDAGLVALDISSCGGLTDQAWLAITEMQGLTSLRLEHMGHLLQFPSMPENLPPVLWHLPRLRVLSLAGSCCHPSKLKLLGAACGSSVTHLDLSTGSGHRAAACCCGAARAAPGVLGAQAAGPPYRRLTSLHERDLCEAAAAFRQLRSFSAGGSALPLRVCTAFLAAAPAGRLELLDLSGCCLDAEHPTAEAAYAVQPPWHRQLFFSSGARRALNFDEMPAVTGNSVSRLQQLHSETDSWQRPATAGRFAAALRRQSASLHTLRLGGVSGLRDAHLSCLRALSALTHLCLAGTGAVVSPALLADAAAGCPSLQRLDASSTAADDACLAATAAMPALRYLAAVSCPGIGAPGAAALAAGPAAASLRWLKLAESGADDAAVAALAAGCRRLRGLQLTGCRSLTPASVERLCQLSCLKSLALGRCPHVMTDAGLLQLAHSLPLLTRLGLSEAQHLSAAGLAAALPLLPVLAHLDLTACAGAGLQDEFLLGILTSGSGTGALMTPANVQLPQGSSSPTGSPFRRRAAAA